MHACGHTHSTGYGYPALIAFNPSKSKYANLKSAFEEKHVKQFLDSVRLVSLPGRGMMWAVSGQPF